MFYLESSSATQPGLGSRRPYDDRRNSDDSQGHRVGKERVSQSHGVVRAGSTHCGRMQLRPNGTVRIHQERNVVPREGASRRHNPSGRNTRLVERQRLRADVSSTLFSLLQRPGDIAPGLFFYSSPFLRPSTYATNISPFSIFILPSKSIPASLPLLSSSTSFLSR